MASNIIAKASNLEAMQLLATSSNALALIAVASDLRYVGLREPDPHDVRGPLRPAGCSCVAARRCALRLADFVGHPNVCSPQTLWG